MRLRIPASCDFVSSIIQSPSGLISPYLRARTTKALAWSFGWEPHNFPLLCFRKASGQTISEVLYVRGHTEMMRNGSRKLTDHKEFWQERKRWLMFVLTRRYCPMLESHTAYNNRYQIDDGAEGTLDILAEASRECTWAE